MNDTSDPALRVRTRPVDTYVCWDTTAPLLGNTTELLRNLHFFSQMSDDRLSLSIWLRPKLNYWKALLGAIGKLDYSVSTRWIMCELGHIWDTVDWNLCSLRLHMIMYIKYCKTIHSHSFSIYTMYVFKFIFAHCFPLLAVCADILLEILVKVSWNNPILHSGTRDSTL